MYLRIDTTPLRCGSSRNQTVNAYGYWYPQDCLLEQSRPFVPTERHQTVAHRLDLRALPLLYLHLFREVAHVDHRFKRYLRQI